MATLSPRTDQSHRVAAFVEANVQLSDKPARPRAKPLRLRPVTVHEDTAVKILTNREQFAAKGDEWGALRPLQHKLPWRKKTHPDGFVEYQVRHEDEYDGPIKRPCDKPLREARSPVLFQGLARAAFNHARGQK